MTGQFSFEGRVVERKRKRTGMLRQAAHEAVAAWHWINVELEALRQAAVGRAEEMHPCPDYNPRSVQGLRSGRCWICRRRLSLGVWNAATGFRPISPRRVVELILPSA